jgi:hypothetical protein
MQLSERAGIRKRCILSYNVAGVYPPSFRRAYVKAMINA